MLNRIVVVVIVVPVAVVLIALAVANRAPAMFTFDPFNPGNPALSVELPLFVLMFLALLAGLVLGSFVTWWKQGRYRKLARRREQELASVRVAAAPRTAAPGTPPALQGPTA